jgi:hypothetical protein
MRLGFLMCHTYAPFHKWLDREFHQLPDPAPAVAEHLDAATRRPEKRGVAIRAVQSILLRWLADAGYTDPAPEEREVTGWDQSLAEIARQLRQTISDPGLRELHPTV